MKSILFITLAVICYGSPIKRDTEENAGFVNYDQDQNKEIVVTPKDTIMTVFETLSKSSTISTSSKPSAAPYEDSSNDTPSNDPGLVDYAGII